MGLEFGTSNRSTVMPVEMLKPTVFHRMEMAHVAGQTVHQQWVGKLDQQIVASILIAQGLQDLWVLLWLITRWVKRPHERKRARMRKTE